MGAHLTMQSTLTTLELNIFQRKFKNFWETIILSQIFIEYKHTIRQYADTFLLDLFTFWKIVKRLYKDYTNLFDPNKYKKWSNNDKIFSIIKKVKIKKFVVLFVISIENLKTLKYTIIGVSIRMKMKKYLRRKNLKKES